MQQNHNSLVALKVLNPHCRLLILPRPEFCRGDDSYEQDSSRSYQRLQWKELHEREMRLHESGDEPHDQPCQR